MKITVEIEVGKKKLRFSHEEMKELYETLRSLMKEKRVEYVPYYPYYPNFTYDPPKYVLTDGTGDLIPWDTITVCNSGECNA